MNLYDSAHAFALANSSVLSALAFLLYMALEDYLPRSKRFKANSTLQGLANLAKKVLIDRVPVVGQLVKVLATPEVTPPPAMPAAPPPPPRNDRGRIHILVLATLGLASGLVVALALNGCSTAVKQTKVAEDALGRAVSVGYRDFNAFDTQRMADIEAEANDGDPTKADTDLKTYTPKRDRAIKALDVAADLIATADQVRVGVEKGTGDPKSYSTYLVPLGQALVNVKQALTDLGVLK